MSIFSLILVFLTQIVKLFIGLLFNPLCISEVYLYGTIIEWAFFQIIAVPFIWLRIPFNVLFLIFLLIEICLVVVAVVRNKRLFTRDSLKKHFQEFNIFLIPAICVILIQVFMYILGEHIDYDDARWLGEASDALEKGYMYLYNPVTGDYIGSFGGETVKDIFSPFSMYIAVLSRMMFLDPATVAHTAYAPVLLILSYIIYYLIGKRLFKGKMEQGAFLLFVSLVILFANGNQYTQSIFSLVRIWQGKAVVAAIIIPLFILLMLQIEADDSLRNWIMMPIASCSACLFSGMGIAISFILTGVYGLYAVVCQRLKRIPYLFLGLLPPIVYGVAYYLLRS